MKTEREAQAHRFFLVLFKDGKLLCEVPLEAASFEPAWECARFLEMRHGRLPAIFDDGIAHPAVPIWDLQAGAPYLKGFHFGSLFQAGEEAVETCVPDAGTPLSCFSGVAQGAAEILLKDGKLKKGDVVTYRVCAVPCERSSSDDEIATPFSVEEIAEPLPLREGSLHEFYGDASPNGEPDPRQMPVFVSSQIIEETLALKEKAREVETGGILIGHLIRDRSVPEIFAHVTAQLPALHTQATVSKLTFTPETWTAAERAMKLRRKDEMILGWWHSHTCRYWPSCAKCEISKRRQCKLMRSFFSSDDDALHSEIFPRAYSIALVVGDVLAEDGSWRVSEALFGWESGSVAERGFHVLAGARSSPASMTKA